MSDSENVETPPEETNTQGVMRQVGVEVEYANLSVLESAGLIEELFGGRQVRESEHRVHVKETRFGDFTAELDWQGAHKHKNSDSGSDSDSIFDFEDDVRAFAGRTASVIVPTEIVCPPVPWPDLDQLDILFDHLRDSGAEGTETGILYGFGLHVNPEVAEETAEYALRHLQAYILLEDWLREQIDIDWARRMLPHIDPFPNDYMRKIVDVAYSPDLETLIRDYVEANQTRNRGLDMTPLFRHLDEATLTRYMDDTRLVKPRPTFHYRLPNAKFSDPSWGPVKEWNRWLTVERLAADKEELHERIAEFMDWSARPRLDQWAEKIKRWFT